MCNTLNVLSIDFDFFQIVDETTLFECYPDGIDLTTELSSVIWSGYYANKFSSEKLKDVKIDKDSIVQLKKIISSCDTSIPVMITNSHADIYDFICNEINNQDKNSIDLINIDMHHDMFNQSDKMDCGNWIKYISEKFDTNITWIANKISDDIFDLNDDIKSKMKYDFESIHPDKIDMVFLCRSDMWFAPHLDKYFDDFKNHIIKTFDITSINKSVKSPRDLQNFIDACNKVLNIERS